MTERKIVDVKVDYHVDFDDIIDDKTPDEIIEAAVMFKQIYKGRDIYFATEIYGYDGGKTLTLRERRLETDQELEQRIFYEEKVKKIERATLAKERKEYERLKKKFEKE
jgi:hypothetical protein